MLLEDSIIIEAPQESVVAFLEGLEDRYLLWHPGHKSLRWLDAGRTRFAFDEQIEGFRLRARMIVTRTDGGRTAVCRPVNPLLRLVFPWMSFAVAPEGAGSRYTHAIRLRIGPFRWLVERRILAPVRRHMRQEAERLRRLVEGSTSGSK